MLEYHDPDRYVTESHISLTGEHPIITSPSKSFLLCPNEKAVGVLIHEPTRSQIYVYHHIN